MNENPIREPDTIFKKIKRLFNKIIGRESPGENIKKQIDITKNYVDTSNALKKYNELSDAMTKAGLSANELRAVFNFNKII